MAFDPDEFLKKKTDDASRPQPGAPAASTFDPDAFLREAGTPVPTGTEPSLVAQTQAGSTAPGAVPQLPVTGYGPGVGSAIAQTTMGQNVGRVMAPYATAASSLMSQYAANPLTKLAPDVLAAAHGVPPPFATAKTIGATQGAFNIGRQIATAPGAVAPSSVPAPTATQIATNPMLAEMAARTAAAEAETAANRSVIQKIAMSKVMQSVGSVAGPVLNTAGRVAGPAGLAYNIYEAAPYMAQAGKELSSGAAQNRMAQARQQMRDMPYSPQFNQSLTAQQAQNILASGSARDIQAFGGLEQLRRIALGQ